MSTFRTACLFSLNTCARLEMHRHAATTSLITQHSSTSSTGTAGAVINIVGVRLHLSLRRPVGQYSTVSIHYPIMTLDVFKLVLLSAIVLGSHCRVSSEAHFSCFLGVIAVVGLRCKCVIIRIYFVTALDLGWLLLLTVLASVTPLRSDPPVCTPGPLD